LGRTPTTRAGIPLIAQLFAIVYNVC
jgi:hypothetical protein